MEVEYKSICENKRNKKIKSDIKIKIKKEYKYSGRSHSPDYFIRPKRVIRVLRKNDIREDFRINDKFVNKIGKNIDR